MQLFLEYQGYECFNKKIMVPCTPSLLPPTKCSMPLFQKWNQVSSSMSSKINPVRVRFCINLPTQMVGVGASNVHPPYNKDLMFHQHPMVPSTLYGSSAQVFIFVIGATITTSTLTGLVTLRWVPFTT